jgi:hypothetical protein
MVEQLACFKRQSRPRQSGVQFLMIQIPYRLQAVRQEPCRVAAPEFRVTLA